MPNHFHLLVRCPVGALSPFMQSISSGYTKRLNLRLGRDGPIFRSRFRSKLVLDAEYRHLAGRYIHRNPIDLGRCEALDEYRWSSLRYYTGRVAAPTWVETAT